MRKYTLNLILVLLISASPVLADRKADSDLLKCCSNLKGIARAAKMYSMHYRGKYPSSLKQMSPKYLKRFPKCPATKKNYLYRQDKKLHFIVKCSGNHKNAGIGKSKPRYDKVNSLGPKSVRDRYKALNKRFDGTRCRSNLKNIGTALEMWYTDHKGHFPGKLKALTPNYLHTIPICPAARRDTYSASYKMGKKPDSYSFYCKGHHHKSEKYPANRPAYDSLKGLK